MRKVPILAIALLAVLVLLVGMGVVACDGAAEETTTPPPGGGEETTTPPPGETTTPPQSGEWVASTGSSQFTFTFTINPDSTGITEFYYGLFAFDCAGWVLDVIPSTVERSSPWSITGGQFTIEFLPLEYPPFESPEYGPDWDIVFQGKFDETGRHASGTWEMSVDGETCQGTWEASPSS